MSSNLQNYINKTKSSPQYSNLRNFEKNFLDTYWKNKIPSVQLLFKDYLKYKQNFITQYKFITQYNLYNNSILSRFNFLLKILETWIKKSGCVLIKEKEIYMYLYHNGTIFHNDLNISSNLLGFYNNHIHLILCPSKNAFFIKFKLKLLGNHLLIYIFDLNNYNNETVDSIVDTIYNESMYNNYRNIINLDINTKNTDVNEFFNTIKSENIQKINDNIKCTDNSYSRWYPYIRSGHSTNRSGITYIPHNSHSSYSGSYTSHSGSRSRIPSSHRGTGSYSGPSNGPSTSRYLSPSTSRSGNTYIPYSGRYTSHSGSRTGGGSRKFTKKNKKSTRKISKKHKKITKNKSNKTKKNKNK